MVQRRVFDGQARTQQTNQTFLRSGVLQNGVCDAVIFRRVRELNSVPRAIELRCLSEANWLEFFELSLRMACRQAHHLENPTGHERMYASQRQTVHDPRKE